LLDELIPSVTLLVQKTVVYDSHFQSLAPELERVSLIRNVNVEPITANGTASVIASPFADAFNFEPRTELKLARARRGYAWLHAPTTCGDAERWVVGRFAG
jgi:hypothetical protein